VVCSLIIASLLLGSSMARAGSIFLTGHDADFHAVRGPNHAGAINLNRVAIGFVRSPDANRFVTERSVFLFVESRSPAPSGHTQGKEGIVASGFRECAGPTRVDCDFEHHDAVTLDGELDKLGTQYDAIVVASDFGGLLTQAELDILNRRSADIVDFLNEGGGLYAMAESNSGEGLTPEGSHFGFLPLPVGSARQERFEESVEVWPIGGSLGLTNADVNGNYAHNFFQDPSGLEIVDIDGQGILSLAGRVELEYAPEQAREE
jgi:hypothetical protein